MRSAQPMRVIPAAARMTASSSPFSALRMRVSRLPRTSTISRSGRMASTCARRRRLDVPSLAPAGSESRSYPAPDTMASRGSTRSGFAAMTRPSGRSVGTSFMEWTARSTVASTSSTSISLVNRPLPPTLASGTSRILSPVVLMILRHTGKPVISSTFALMYSDCHSASLLPRVPMVSPWRLAAKRLSRLVRIRALRLLGHPEQPLQAVRALRRLIVESPQATGRFDVDVAVLLGRDDLEARRGAVQHLVDDGLGKRLDRPDLLLRQAPQPLERPGQLLLAHRLGPGPHGGHGRHDLHGVEPRVEGRDLLFDDDLGPSRLAHALLEVGLDHAVEVVDVVEEHVGEVVDLGVDVAGDGDVDEEQRTAAAAAHGARDGRPLFLIDIA